jgi:2-keto-4-pentenoate hydratase/2-oxohepta-3-ene-1,7-dioic acid hydratase in catechol pathway
MKIICIGRNYAEHAHELGNSVPDEMLFFLKPDTAFHNQAIFYLPQFLGAIHHEIELVVKINKTGKNIEQQFAHNYYNELTVGIDFTARDLQEKLRKQGYPWEKAKAFDHSAVVGKFVEKDQFLRQDKSMSDLNFHLLKNKNKVQHGFTKDMIYTVDQIIAEVSKYFTLKIGDLIFTGTPSGVAAINIGDTLEGFLMDQPLFALQIK